MNYTELIILINDYIKSNFMNFNLSEFETAVSQCTNPEELKTLCLDHFHSIFINLEKELEQLTPLVTPSYQYIGNFPCHLYIEHLDAEEKTTYLALSRIKQITTIYNNLLSHPIACDDLITNPNSKLPTSIASIASRLRSVGVESNFDSIAVAYLKKMLSVLQVTTLREIPAQCFISANQQLHKKIQLLNAVHVIMDVFQSTTPFAMSEIYNIIRTAYSLHNVIASTTETPTLHHRIKTNVILRLNHMCSPATFESQRINKNLLFLNHKICDTTHAMQLYSLLDITSKYILQKQEMLNDSLNRQIKQYSALLQSLAKTVLDETKRSDIDKNNYCLHYIKNQILPFEYHDDSSDSIAPILFQDLLKDVKTLDALLQKIRDAIPSFNENIEPNMLVELYQELTTILYNASSLFDPLPEVDRNDLHNTLLTIQKNIIRLKINYHYQHDDILSARIYENIENLLSEIDVCEVLSAIPLLIEHAIDKIKKQCSLTSPDFNRKVDHYVGLLTKLSDTCPSLIISPRLIGNIAHIRQRLITCTNHDLMQQNIRYFDDASLCENLLIYMHNLQTQYKSTRLLYLLREYTEGISTKSLEKIARNKNYWLKSITNAKDDSFLKAKLNEQLDDAFLKMQSVFRIIEAYLAYKEQLTHNAAPNLTAPQNK